MFLKSRNDKCYKYMIERRMSIDNFCKMVGINLFEFLDFTDGKEGEIFEENELTKKETFLKKFPLTDIYLQQDYLQKEKTNQIPQNFVPKEYREKHIVQFPAKKVAVINSSYYKTGF